MSELDKQPQGASQQDGVVEKPPSNTGASRAKERPTGGPTSAEEGATVAASAGPEPAAHHPTPGTPPPGAPGNSGTDSNGPSRPPTERAPATAQRSGSHGSRPRARKAPAPAGASSLHGPRSAVEPQVLAAEEQRPVHLTARQLGYVETASAPPPAVQAVSPYTESVWPARRLVGYAVIAAAIVLVSALIALAVSSLREETYAAQADVFFPLDSDRSVGFLREDRRLATQVRIITSRELLAPIAAANAIQFDELEKDVSGSIEGPTEVVRIEVRDEDPDRAELLTGQVLDAYLAVLAGTGVDPSADLIGAEIETTRARLTEIASQLDAIDSSRGSGDQAGAAVRSAQEQALLAENASLLARLGGLENRLIEAEVDDATVEQPTVIARPHVLDDPVAPRPGQAAAIGALAGLIVAGVVLFVLNRRRRLA